MAKWSISSYNRFIGKSMTRYGLERKQAAQMYREMRGKLGKPVFQADIKRHPRIAKKASERAFAKVHPPRKIIGGGPRKPPTIELPEEFEELEDFDQEAESSEEGGDYE